MSRILNRKRLHKVFVKLMRRALLELHTMPPVSDEVVYIPRWSRKYTLRFNLTHEQYWAFHDLCRDRRLPPEFEYLLDACDLPPDFKYPV